MNRYLQIIGLIFLYWTQYESYHIFLVRLLFYYLSLRIFIFLYAIFIFNGWKKNHFVELEYNWYCIYLLTVLFFRFSVLIFLMGAAVTIELNKPIDASDIRSSNNLSVARNEVIRLRKELGHLASLGNYNAAKGTSFYAIHSSFFVNLACFFF